MSLPNGFLDELKDRLSISQVVGRKVTWDQRKSNPGKGDYWAPCPFHQEKTASFHVDDRKGFYYCFGCQEKGDALNFVISTENVSFMEAVEILAREAGMPVPKQDPQAQKQADRRAVLAEVMEQSVRFFRMQLQAGAGTQARDYLDRRELPGATRDRFEIGFSPNDRAALWSYLTGKGIAPKDIIDCGMAIEPDNGTPYDRFRGRIMFPIRDPRGRCIAFGGRALDPNARAKYLNSPETILFDKGRSLYNHGPAREAAGKASSLIVAEGYMDVIALAQAGFDHAVAPLGTAITENQLQLIWRLTPEPVIALDGDKSGLRAALRLIDLALPMLEAGKSLRFCLLPEGQDPDDLLKQSGPDAMQKLLAGAQPMVNLLWERETEGKDFDSPERRAALDASLRTAIATIRDPSIKNHYTAAIKELRRDLFAPRRQDNWAPGKFRKPKIQSPIAETKSSFLAQQSQNSSATRLREAIILTAAIQNPDAAAHMESQLERCSIEATDLKEIHLQLLASLHPALSTADAKNSLLETMTEALGYNPLGKLMSLPPVRIHPHLRAATNPELVAQTLSEELVKHAAILGADVELKEAEQDLEGLADEGLTWRIQQATDARTKATKAEVRGSADTGEDRENLSQHLQKLIDDQIWVKKKR